MEAKACAEKTFCFASKTSLLAYFWVFAHGAFITFALAHGALITLVE
jgi:hypothetical protein